MLVGDLVVKKEAAHLLDNEDVEEPVEVDIEEETESKPKQSKKDYVKDAILEVTPDNINDYTIYDVVMPLVGYDTKMPPSAEIQAIYDDLLNQDGITWGML